MQWIYYMQYDETSRLDLNSCLNATIEGFENDLPVEIIGSELVSTGVLFMLRHEQFPGMALVTAQTAIRKALKNLRAQ